MALYDDFPYTNFHSLNLDWIVKKLSELENGESSEEFSSTATLAHNLSGNYPYTNFHSLNLDWIIRSMYELESDFETVENEWQGLRATVLLNDQIKNAILQCFQNVAWINDQGQTYYDTLRDLFFPPVVVSTLTAVLDQGERVFHTGEDVNVIKDYLTVTAKLTDGTLITVPSTQYILTGSLSQDGPNIIVVSYMNASTTITVNAVAVSLVSISAVYTQSGAVYASDSLDSLKGDLVVTATYDDSSTTTVPSADYTLSGTLAVGTSVITVTYEGMTATFNVTVTTPDHIANIPLTFVGSSANDGAWDSSAQSGYVVTKGASQWPGMILQGLKYTYGNVSTKSIHLKATLVATGISSTASLSFTLGLYTTANPSGNGSTIRKANASAINIRENGTTEFDQTFKISELSFASTDNSWYLGISFMANGPTGARLTFSNLQFDIVEE